jgi:lipopolysaccharide/colanic/teichoic acid biosynthesis glycosyltransferase
MENSFYTSFHLFAEGWDPQEKYSPADSNLYPDRLNGHPKEMFRILKRAMDIVGSAIALLLLAPLFAVISVGIKLNSQGPVLSKQERIGQYGRRFTFLKFRSMRLNSDPKIHQGRVTHVGEVLRKTSLDGLPQFLNVLKGQMSLIGPRPLTPYELESYDEWHGRRLLEAKPGITGLWQVKRF